MFLLIDFMIFGDFCFLNVFFVLIDSIMLLISYGKFKNCFEGVLFGLFFVVLVDCLLLYVM